MAVKVIRIYELDGIVNARLELVGSFFEVEVPAGPVAGGYINKRLSFEQFAALLGGGYSARSLPSAQNLATGGDVAINTLYGITGDWNATGTDTTVYVHGVRPDTYHQLGIVYDAQGAGQLVEVDVAAGTYQALADDPRFGATTPTDPAAPLSAVATTFPFVGISAGTGLRGFTSFAATQTAGMSTVYIYRQRLTLTESLSLQGVTLYAASCVLTIADKQRIRLGATGISSIVNQSILADAIIKAAGDGRIEVAKLTSTITGTPTALQAPRLRGGHVSAPILFTSTEAALTLENIFAGGAITNSSLDPADVATLYVVGAAKAPNVGLNINVVEVGGGGSAVKTVNGVAPDTAGNVQVAATGAAVATPSGTVLKFTQDAEYAPIYNGTFTVDLTGAKVGVVVFAELGPATTQPVLDAAKFELVGNNNYQAGQRLGFGFRVAASGRIEYFIYPKA